MCFILSRTNQAHPGNTTIHVNSSDKSSHPQLSQSLLSSCPYSPLVDGQGYHVVVIVAALHLFFVMFILLLLEKKNKDNQQWTIGIRLFTYSRSLGGVKKDNYEAQNF